MRLQQAVENSCYAAGYLKSVQNSEIAVAESDQVKEGMSNEEKVMSYVL
jgi:hypothetical protein